ncbi:conserved protein of unknown function [Acidithiobacillus ferrivorans]|uniref:Uncharacterized protein n=1 Tax=Acidithiobacillus ferrivorans TaxID=160808 RepID=A0A060UPX4_9PROT|nr:hypothetical protein [Acidithiobacillus ferrivorans]CDQ10465.1 conserved hypothetical protein [Acidithiobacillus ferrivorans]SMH64493.1 conserved protein of unknown function [Acidithiobacillus ferrivorans]
MDADFYLEKLSPLVGGTISGLVRSGNDYGQGEFIGLVITMPDGLKKTLVLLSDDDGNAPGSFEIAADDAGYELAAECGS